MTGRTLLGGLLYGVGSVGVVVGIAALVVPAEPLTPREGALWLACWQVVTWYGSFLLWGPE
jgi:hypothetical protein